MVQIDENREFISPFSYRQGYDLSWKKIDSRWQGIDELIDTIPKREKKILALTKQVKFITGLQIIKTFCPNINPEGGKKLLKKLNKYGFLVKHVLSNKHRQMTIFTLGPAGAKVIGEPYIPNWWMKIRDITVLKQLIINQFYLRIYRTSDNCRFLNMPYPISGIVVMDQIEFPIVAVRGDIEDVAKDVDWSDLSKALIICDNIAEIEHLAPDINIPARFTTDFELCNVPLNQAFYQWNHETKTVQRDLIDLFHPQA